MKKISLINLLVFISASALFAQRITESLTNWTLGTNKPEIKNGVRGNGGSGNYVYCPVGTDPFNYFVSSQGGEGSVTFWIYDPDKCQSSTNPGYAIMGPAWGLITPINQLVTAGIYRADYLGGCIGYKVWSNITPDTIYDYGGRGSYYLPWDPGWWKWTINGTLNNISYTIYNIPTGCIGPCQYYINYTKIYDATSFDGVWTSIFGNGWKGIWFKGDNISGIEDISVDVVSGTGVFFGFGTDAVAKPYNRSTWGNIKALFR